MSKRIAPWYIKSVCNNWLGTGLNASFSQSGEDLIILSIFNFIGLRQPTYLDIGAYHPYHLSNTALLYQKGFRGVNIEPNPDLISLFARERPDDINLNLGIANTPGEMEYYMMSTPTLNTFSRAEAEHYCAEGYTITARTKIPVRTITDVVNTYCAGQFPDFLSLDIEGLELSILKGIDYDQSSPTVICVETLGFSTQRKGTKDQDVISFLLDQGYFIYADTYINTIFLKRKAWNE
jgi:FkbM family methyltransferase